MSSHLGNFWPWVSFASFVIVNDTFSVTIDAERSIVLSSIEMDLGCEPFECIPANFRHVQTTFEKYWAKYLGSSNSQVFKLVQILSQSDPSLRKFSPKPSLDLSSDISCLLRGGLLSLLVELTTSLSNRQLWIS